MKVMLCANCIPAVAIVMLTEKSFSSICSYPLFLEPEMHTFFRTHVFLRAHPICKNDIYPNICLKLIYNNLLHIRVSITK